MPELAQVYHNVRAYLENLPSDTQTPYATIAAIWSGFLGRRDNFPPLEALPNMRQGDYALGLGTSQGNLEEDALQYDNTYQMVRYDVPPEWLHRLQEPSFGNPLQHTRDGITASQSFMLNISCLWRCQHLYDTLLAGKKSLRVLEIGAGWGGVAWGLHQLLPIHSYAIVDIPQNLFLSAIYLQMTLPDKHAHMVDSTPVADLAPDSLYFISPHYLDNVQASFDLVINTFSMQEMELPTVQAYIQYVKNHLSDGGLMLSVNAHDKTDLTRPSDYGYEAFHVHTFRAYRHTLPNAMNTYPYEVVFGLRHDSTPSYEPAHTNALGELVQLGLSDDLLPLATAYTNGTLSPEGKMFLDTVNTFFDTRDNTLKARVLEALHAQNAYSGVTEYLAGCYHFVKGDTAKAQVALEQACDAGLSHLARSRAFVMLAMLLPDRQAHALAQVQQSTPNLYREMKAFLAQSGALRTWRYNFASRLHMDVTIPTPKPALWQRVLRRLQRLIPSP